MSLTATFDDAAGRVRLVAAAAPGTADTALFERSLDGTVWTTVRGGEAVPLLAGGCRLDDYEYPAGVPTMYRVSYVDSADVVWAGTGTVASANNAAVTPTLPGGVAEGDALYLVAGIRGTAGSANTPAGWTLIYDSTSLRVFTRRYTAGVTAPTVTFSGGVAGDDTLAAIAALRNGSTTPSTSATVVNASQQNVPVPGFVVPDAGSLALRPFKKQAASTAVALSGWGQLAYGSSSAGSGATLGVLGFGDYAANTAVPAQTVTVTGGVAAASRAASIVVPRAAYVTQETATVTPAQTGVWLKNIGRAYLSRKITVTDIGTITRRARGGAQDIIARTLGIAVTDLRGGAEFTLQVTTPTLTDAADLEARLAAGDVVFLQPPDTDDCPIPTGYFWVGDVARSQHSKRTTRRFFDLPMVEVAAPSSSIVPITATYQSVLNTYATYAALLAGEPTYADVIDMTGVPDVVVP
ncbi:hypothetical protein [Labedaea rhizosphaerae]|uniref:Uncharacterized protein n=1 Tax=Labedaea rhizosphaerae TaxID=598644 RepID=A0A4R6SDA9_LABRH|nr:hypothetical protein [Labedaea rhizosphaerae]TDP97644.1 hypothetical protein EV186_103608 [Labedaea rhizosphaerae]